MLAAFAAGHGITYPLLADAGSHAIRALGLLNEQVHEQHAAYGIGRVPEVEGVAYPAAFFLNWQGVVTGKRFLQSYRERETGVGLLEAGFGLEALARGPEAVAEREGVRVRAYLDSPTYRRAQRLRLTVVLEVAAGLHVYGEPIPEGYTPTTVEVTPVPGLEVGPPEAPEPCPLRVEGLAEQFFVHAGELRLARPLTFWEPADDLALRVTVRFQACSEVDCLPPQAVELTLPLRRQNLVDTDR